MGWRGHSLAAVAALVLGLPALLILALRARTRAGLSQRLGWVTPSPPPAAGCVWIHAASVGETLAALRLVDVLSAQGRGVCLSTNTRTARDLARSRRPALPAVLAPLDHPWCVSAWLRRVRPAALVTVETELWPVRLAVLSARGLPVAMVSARLSPRSLTAYTRLPGVFRRAAQRLAAVGARSDEDAGRFGVLGVPPSRVRVTGDLKLEPPDTPPPLPPDLAAALDAVPIVVAASTHEGEEAVAVDCLDAATRAGLRAALVVAPRHPPRFEAVAAQLAARGPLRRRSALGAGPLGPGELLLLDSLGELPSVFARAAVAFVGGSLVDRGGHNVLEPLQSGCPVLVGPHTTNVDHVLRLLRDSGAVRSVRDGPELVAAVLAVLRDPEPARARAEGGRRLLESQRGAAERSARLVGSLLS